MAATDIETGEPVIFDSKKLTIEMDHVLASCGFLPEFAPLEINGRLVGDGGLSINAPFDPVLEDNLESDLLVYVIDLYARDGARPNSLEAAVERKNDLLFGNQTFIRLKYCADLRKLRRQSMNGFHESNGGHASNGDKIMLLSYRPGMEEPGPEKSFEFSAGAVAQRWEAGFRDMQYSEHARQIGDIIVVRRPEQSGSAGSV